METCVYGAYGYRVAFTINVARTAYAGYVRETDLPWYLLGMRIFIPWLRRFICPDPLSPFGAGGFNRYAYGVGDPINRIDPLGNASWKWLGDLLSRVGGAIGKGVSMVFQVTPATALTTIGTVADAVAVATTIGAVAAVALNDAHAAGVLGWVAAGSGVAGLGLGVAGQTAFKGPRRANRGADSVSNSGLPGPARGFQDKFTAGNPKPARKLVHSTGGHEIYVYKGEASVTAKIPDRVVRASDGAAVGLVAEWTEFPNFGGGLNYAADVEILNSSGVRHLDSLITAIGQKADTKPIYLLSGVHGVPSGKNWSRGKRLHAEQTFLDDDVADLERLRGLLGEGGDAREMNVYDLANTEKKNYQDFIKYVDAHIIHAYCYGVADHKLLKSLQCTARTATYSL